MEANIINNLTTRMMNCYDECKLTNSMFVKTRMYEAAKTNVVYYTNRAFGAVEFAMTLCHENGYPDLANEIMNKWNNIWSVWFNDLIQEVL